jgi:hypothetical protein
MNDVGALSISLHTHAKRSEKFVDEGSGTFCGFFCFLKVVPFWHSIIVVSSILKITLCPQMWSLGGANVRKV